MDYIKWDGSLELGIKDIDEQHKGLIETINLFESVSNAADRYKICLETIMRLKKYFDEHFMTEESYMIEYDYPDFVSHKKEHSEFIKNVLDFEMACVEFYAPYTPILEFLREWLTKHVKDTDIKMGKFLNEKMKQTK